MNKTEVQHEASSPSASSIFLPLGRRPRKGSHASANTQIESDNLCHALDEIHSAASQSNELTVFNEFAQPPGCESEETKNTSGGGLGSLYKRFFRSSVDGVKDIVGSTSKSPEQRRTAPYLAEERHSDHAGSQNEAGPILSTKGTSPLPAVPEVVSKPQKTSVMSRRPEETQTIESRAPRVASNTPSVSSRASGPPHAALRPPLLPFNKAPLPTAVDPSTTEVTVNAFPHHSTEASPGLGAFPPYSQNIQAELESQPPRRPTLEHRKSLQQLAQAPFIPAEEAEPAESLHGRQEVAESHIVEPAAALAHQGTAFPAASISAMSSTEPHSSAQGSTKSGSTTIKPTHSGATSGVQTPAQPTYNTGADQHKSKLNTQLRIVTPAKAVSHDGHEHQPLNTGSQPLVSGTLQQTLRHHSVPHPEEPRLTSKLLGRDFWMKDENAKDCFHCGEAFTTFRRKHHCRTCGQIFCARCTSLISGSPFGESGSIRVCKPCEARISAYDDDSTDYSGDEQSPAVTHSRSSDRLPSSSNLRALQYDDDDASSVSISLSRRPLEPAGRLSSEIEGGQLSRPTSSRSLRSTLGSRSRSVHKRHHSRPQFIRNLKPYHDDSAPFQRRIAEEMNSRPRFSAFHRDSIIDPELTEYLSGGETSEDASSLPPDYYEPQVSPIATEPDKISFGNFFAAMKKGRSRASSRSLRNDDSPLSYGKASPRSIAGRRSLQTAQHQRLPSKLSKDVTMSPLQDSPRQFFSPSAKVAPGGFKMTRSSSMRGATAPAMELNKASLEHVHKMLRQLLDKHDIPHPHRWQSALMPILLKVTDDVAPDVQQGDDMDIRHYVKLKRIPGGRPGDTCYVSGLVFTKNLALKSMPRQISRPRILIIAFPLEYARQEQHFMSLEPVVRQEEEFLQNLVSRICALEPTLLLAEKTISGRALELLSEAGVATAYNVRPTVLEAVSRCTSAKIITSMDRLAAVSDPTGESGTFEVKTYNHEGRKKTYMYIYGCPPQLGCTIILRGASMTTLSKIKRIADFMIYVVYNLQLETCLMRDEFAKIPSPEEHEAANAHAEQLMATKETNNSSQDESEPAFYEDMMSEFQSTILSVSPYVKFQPPHLLMRARDLEVRLHNLKRLREHDNRQLTNAAAEANEPQDEKQDQEKTKSQRFLLVSPEMIDGSSSVASLKQREVLQAVHNAEYERSYHVYQAQKRQWENYILGNINMFDPFAHQNIVVLYSILNTKTFAPCVGPEMLTFGYYDETEGDTTFEADCTLGQYVEHLCECANIPCEGDACDELMLQHHRRYVHGEAQVRVYVEPHPSKLPGLESTILMWNCCRVCGNETPPISMSKNTWRYSFGKYLEVSFWSESIHPRAGLCPHDMHRDHNRYFGYKNVSICLTYDRIDILELSVPRLRVTWKVENDLRLRNEVYTKAERRLQRFFASVKARLDGINVESVSSESSEACCAEIARLRQKATEDLNVLIKQHQEQYMSSKYWEIIPLNRMIRSVQEKVVEWDAIFTEFEKNFFPSEKDIRRLATLQLKRFLDRGVSVSPGEENATTPPEADEKTEPNKQVGRRINRRLTLTPQQAKDVLASVVEEDSGKTLDEKHPAPSKPASPIPIGGPKSVELQEQQSVSGTPESFPSSSSVDQMSGNSPSQPSRKEGVSASPKLGLETQDAASLTSEDNAPRPEPSLHINKTRDAPDQVGGLSRTSSPVQAFSKAESFPKEYKLGLSSSTTPPTQKVSAIPRPQDKARLSAHGVQMSARKSPQPSERSGQGHVPQRSIGVASATTHQTTPAVVERRLHDRSFGLGVKPSKVSAGHSMIPRSVQPPKRPSRVSSLARHFEQLSREFENERQKARQQRANSIRLSRAIPTRSSNPIVQVYKNVHDAVERDPSEEDILPRGAPETIPEQPASMPADVPSALQPLAQVQRPESPASEAVASIPDTQPRGEGYEETGERKSERTEQTPEPNESPKDDEAIYSDEEKQEEELPKHERVSLIKTLTNFWAERSSSNWTALDYPLSTFDHVFEDSDIIVREDEPSSLIAFALDSEDYKQKLAACQSVSEPKGSDTSLDEADSACEDSLLRETGTHLKYQFQESQTKMTCKIFYAEQFDALRRKCGVSHRIVESLSRCMKWDSQGGKSQSLFLKTMDQRFILKSLSPMESQAFLKFAPGYFSIMSEVLFHELPSAIAKMFGFYQVIIKNPATDVEFDCYLLLMENLFYDRTPTRIFDLKGSMRNRKVESTGKRDEVLLDENMVEFIFENPLFTRSHSKKLLNQSVWNDTLFLARQNVMDYSLMLAIDEQRKELVVGIIDCIRTYTWDKKVESWIKGGGKNRPTIMGPKEYKNRFRQAMARYVLHAPDTWYHFQPAPIQRPQPVGQGRIEEFDDAQDEE